MWVVGDIHGRLYTLLDLIDELPKGAEITCTGDLFDRGINNEEVYDFISDSKTVNTVLGNHDEFIVVGDAYLHVRNGGEWYYQLSQEKRDEIRNWLITLPVAKLLEVDGKEAVVTHAPMSAPSRSAMLWERDVMADLVPDFNIFGHNIVDEPVVLDDRAAIDTGMERLTAIHWPSLEVVSVNTRQEDVSPLMWENINARKET